ncbi:MAG: glutamate--tRNA ligase [Polyangiaceae bacterium]
MTELPRVRFAPSPTGYLHIGGVRTALFNWLWAKKTGGTFVLRIEDTDQERSTPENEKIIIDSMRWLGLDWAEGPDTGGPHGPYRQMERLGIYQEFVEKLISRGAAYRCYCTKDELDQARAAVQAKDPKAQFRYPGTCRDRKDQPDRPFVIRFKAPSTGEVTYKDLVFGEVTTPNNTHQDAVLVRSDGVPLYNFGAVVDDITMGINLVARGRDHMINTPPQILLYEALGHRVPQFAHLPMMLAPDGKKLSKRNGSVSVGDYKDRGIPPAALLNYLVRFGWSFGDEEIFSLSDLVSKFSWDRCGTSDGKFDTKKLNAVVFEHLKRRELMSDDEYLDGVLPFMAARGLTVEREEVRPALAVYRERGPNWVDAADAMDYLFREPPKLDEAAVKKFLTPEKADMLEAVATSLEATGDEWRDQAKELEAGFQALLAERGWQLKEVAQPMRVALTGRSASPGLFEVAVLLGKATTLARLRRAAATARAAGASAT